MADDTTAPETEPTEPARRPLSEIGRERFGHQFYGPLAEDADAPAPEPQPEDEDDGGAEPPADGDEEIGAEAEDHEISGDEPDDEDDRSEEVLIGEALEDDAEPHEDAAQTLSSIEDVARRLDIDPGDLYGIRVPTRDGAEITLGQLKDSYHDLVDVSKNTQTLAQRLDESVNAAEALVEEAEGLLNSDSAKIDWDDLRQNDPAEYAARKAEFSERRDRIKQLKESAKGQREAADRQFQSDEEIQERHRKFLAEQHEQLVRRLPEWGDKEKRPEAVSRLNKYLKTEGFSEDEIKAAADHRIVVLAEKARRYDEARQKVQTAKKQVKKVAKRMPPGSPKPKQQQDQERVQQAQQRLKQSGRMEDAVAALRAKRGASGR